ncbi:BPSS1780 family membrane protein [Candidatus Vallotia tarda]|nr:BPSS1780 family membrane protein [Candidatus Vallotia tarda]
MQLIETSAKSGYIWIGKGIWLFQKNPLNLLALLLTYLFSMMLVVNIPVIGYALWLILVPGFSIGFMSACRDVLANKHVFPLTLFTGFRSHGRGVAWRLLQLGLIYCVLVTTSLFLSSIISGDWTPLLKIMSGEVKLDDDVDYRRVLFSSIVSGLVVYMPTIMLFWFAPVLTAWHSVPPVKAMFCSFVICWRNRIAFLVYLATWFAVIIVTSLVLGLAVVVLNTSNGVLTALLPVSVILWTVIYCSFYMSYCGCLSFEPHTSPGTDYII